MKNYSTRVQSIFLTRESQVQPISSTRQSRVQPISSVRQSQAQQLNSTRQSRLLSILLVLFSVAIATFLALTLVAMAHGQTLQDNASTATLTLQYPQVEASQFPRIVSYVTVADSVSATIGGLTENHFIVAEDGVRELPVIVEEITDESEGVSIVLAMDRSGSIEEELPKARAAASAFVNLMGVHDQAALVSFSSDVRLDQAFTQDRALLNGAINALAATGGTAIYDAAIFSADLLLNTPGRKAIIIMTDGQDKDSDATLEQALQRFAGASIPIFAIGLGMEVSEANLRTLAESSGGRYYLSPTSNQLEEVYRAIATLLHHSYRITYTTHNPTTDGTLRRARIEVNYEAATAFAHNTYRAPDHVPIIAPITQQALAPEQDFQILVEIPAASKYIYSLFDLQFVLTYDKRYVRVQTPSNTNVLPLTFFGSQAEFTFTTSVDTSIGRISFRFKRNAGLAPVEGRGAFVQINFRALASLPDSASLNFNLVNLAAKDKNNWPVAMQAVNLTLQSSGMIVWPGDTNNNGVVELTDVTMLGLHWEIAGPKRLGAGNQNAWQPQLAKKFVKVMATHADANGSGRIDERDLFPIGLNWRKTKNASTPKTKSFTAPDGLVKMVLLESTSQTHRLQLHFQNINHADLAGMSFRMNYPQEHVSILEAQIGKAWGSAPLMIKHDDQNAGAFAMGLMIPAGEFILASEGTLVELFIHAEEQPHQEDFMFNEFVVVSPSGELRELSVEQDGSGRVSAIPRELILHPAYPNPFRLDDVSTLQTGMKIQYDLPENAAVSVAIYNTTGQRVRLITATLNESGRHYLHWEGLNDMGRHVSSGLYLVKVEAAGESGRAYQSTQKATVVR